MRRLSFLAVILSLTFAVFVLMPPSIIASGSRSVQLNDPEIDLNDKVSLQRGAKLFVDYCLSCHSASFMRYDRMAADIGFTDEQLKKDMMFTTDKVGDVMKVAMSPQDAAAWFGTQPPDLSVVSRSRGVDWLYSYLLGFYEDPNLSRPFGVNNIIFPEVGMPHVLIGLQGIQRKRREAHPNLDETHGFRTMEDALELIQPGSMDDVSKKMLKLSLINADKADSYGYQSVARDLVAFLAYMGEPAKVQRQELGVWVLVFLAIFFIVAFALKKEYWKDIH
uniref:Ubiquinol-cytochrome c reductase cytochrome c1 subunit n=1 Tax=Candidatus Kentrum eta TaxID=2126337 RepID=A0A450V5U1_9GAMM|nr:MAG: ubiquinol-cytochrome c reductase cytochrome c1 subunit [Candidatus Kentron sp. H]VFK03058.1 MAG: ubiquinol-cytochrome c reductase cytochrome c1 subunit [Candidatus Kentron sp. H]